MYDDEFEYEFEDYSKEIQIPGSDRTRHSSAPLILVDSLCTSAKRVLDELDKSYGIASLGVWSRDDVINYERYVNIEYENAPLVEYDHVCNDGTIPENI